MIRPKTPTHHHWRAPRLVIRGEHHEEFQGEDGAGFVEGEVCVDGAGAVHLRVIARGSCGEIAEIATISGRFLPTGG